MDWYVEQLEKDTIAKKKKVLEIMKLSWKE